ncbi:MAG: ABC transporter ATP-binding protein/permease [Candidatus Sumerlaea chitinivorans]|uniref:Lipid A export ATP-binding/permease protein MsbA n=1 Tax=Sumerlaea chitinivorans TaxID=2250252 RepID=A0A2Z4Y7K8_SUMC1|nr:Lipid A export ATP-binding/permease protein MsbA [Candidatus Sumerlaea chitinivorans]MCX7963729.1 ABC transporter ATP-binding protein/permease [Candidatus Sumerlaea chitinivorans]
MAYSSLYHGLRPYLRKHWWRITGGVLLLVGANYYQVRVAAVVGQASDAIKLGSANARDFVNYALWVVGFTLILAVCRLFMRLLIVGASRDIEYRFRNDIYEKLLRLPPSYYDHQRTGDLISKVTNDVEAVRMVLGPGVLQFSNSAILFPIAIFQMLRIDPLLTVVAMLPMAALPFVVNYYGNRIHQRFRRVQDHYSVISAMVQENLAGVRVVKAFCQEEPQIRLFDQLNDEYVRRNMSLAKIQSAFFPMLHTIAGVAVVVLLWAGASHVVTGRITVGRLVEFSLIQLMLFWPMMAFGWTVSLLQRGAASMERIREVMVLEDDPALGSRAGRVSLPQDSSVEFRNLTFRYTPDRPPALRGITLKVPAGSSLGVVGPTGSGKSTLALLIAKIYPTPPGQLFVGGADVCEIPATELRKRLGIVFQEPFLFSDTIANNIAFGAPTATREQIIEVARLAHIAHEIEQFPHGYDTMLGERGINLSGGQKQRTALARAILRDPEILILDDALSAVDTETEARIIESLREIMRQRTTIVIAHRISAVMHCDNIIVLDGGEIVEQGNHEALLALGGLYARLYEKQQLADSLEREVG